MSDPTVDWQMLEVFKGIKNCLAWIAAALWAMLLFKDMGGKRGG